MREHWVRPPVVAVEPRPAWVAVWRFRLVALLLTGLLVLAGVLLVRQLTGANAQDPGVGALSPTLAAALSAAG